MSRKDDLATYKGFYDGDLDVIYSHFASRRISQDAKDADNALSKTRFTFTGHIRILIDKLVNYLPVEFDVEASLKGSEDPNEAWGKEITNWLESSSFDGKKTFWEVLPGVYKTGYKFGTVYLKCFIKDEEIHFKKMYSEDVTIVVNPNNVFEVQKIVFDWTTEIEDEERAVNTVDMREVITDKEYQILQDGIVIETTPHKFDRIPVVILKHEEIDGSQYGESMIAKLLESQQNINYTESLRQWGNKMNSYQVLCVDPIAYKDVTVGSEIKISPGMMFKYPIKAVGGNIDLTSMENEIDFFEKEIHEMACVPRKKSLDSLVSGTVTATEINALLKDMNEAGKRYISQCKKAFEEMCELYWFMLHGQEIDVTINYPSMDAEDMEWRKWQAEFLTKLGFYDEAMIKGLGYEETALKALKEQKQKTDAEDQANYELEFEKNRKKDELDTEPDQPDQ